MAIHLPKPPYGAWLKREDDVIVLGAILDNDRVFGDFIITIVFGVVIFAVFYSAGKQEEVNYYIPFAFILPFILLFMVLLKEFLLTLFGKVEIRFYEKEATIFTGIYKIGFTQKFVYKNVETIENFTSKSEDEEKSVGFNNYWIKIEEEKTIKFAKNMADKRRAFMIKTLRTLMQLEGNKIKDIIEPNFTRHLIP